MEADVIRRPEADYDNDDDDAILILRLSLLLCLFVSLYITPYCSSSSWEFALVFVNRNLLLDEFPLLEC